MGTKLIIKDADFSINGILPEFQQLKCIVAATNMQTIKSPISFPVRGRIVSDVYIPEISNSSGAILGRGDVSETWPDEFRLEYFNNSTYSSKVILYINKGWKNPIITSLNIGRHILDFSRANGYIDNISVGTLYTPTEEQSAISSFGIFGKYRGLEGSITSRVLPELKLYSFKMYSDRDDDTSLILDAIPVKRFADNKVGLYDTISGKYLFCDNGTNPNYEELD